MVAEGVCQNRLPGPAKSREEMSPGDYVSERLLQKSLSRLVQDFVPVKQQRKYMKVLVPLIHEIFGTKYFALRPIKDVGNPRAAFQDVFRETLNSRNVSDLGGLDKDEILRVADGLIKKVYESIPPDYFLPPSRSPQDPFDKPVCIIGAGAAGLYTAMILDDFGIKYEILEASGRNGGRIFTKNLEEGAEGQHQYFDVGAMRFPDIPMMARTFELFDRLGLKKCGELIPYNLRGPNNPMFFNNIHTSNTPTGDFFKMGEKNGGMVPDKYVCVFYVHVYCR